MTKVKQAHINWLN